MRICPFISHLLAEGSSNTLAVSAKGTVGCGSETREDIVVLGYDGGDESASVQTQVITDTRTETQAANHLHCLKESCRFYQKASGECQFDLMYSKLTTVEPAERSAHALEITRDIDKIWKFQTKGVAEIVESLADVEKKQAESIGSLKTEFGQKLDEVAGGLTKSSLRSIQTELESLKQRIEGREEGFDNLSTTVSDFVTGLEENLKELKTLSDGLSRQVSDIKDSLPQEKSIAGVVQTQKENEEKLSTWREDITEKLVALTSRQGSWETRFEELLERQRELSAYMGTGKRHYEEEKTRQANKESRKYNNLGVTSFHNGAYEMARDQFLQSVKLDPEFAEAYNNLGLSYTELDEEEKATESFTKAVELNPSLHAAYNNLGYVFFKQGNYEQAVEMYNQALGRSSKNSPAYANLGNAYYRLGRIDKAREAWMKALELDPANEKAKRSLQRINEKTK